MVNWNRIGNGLVRDGRPCIELRSEPDWHLIDVGLAMDRYKIGAGLARIGIRLEMDWHRIGIRLTMDRHRIGNVLAQYWHSGSDWATYWRVCRELRMMASRDTSVGSRIVLVPSGLCTMSVWNGSRLE